MRALGALPAVAILLSLNWRAQAGEVSFRREVMAVLSKAGCNAGACHGNQYGKGGFKLSLRGEHPAEDHRALLRDQSGRRVNRLEPGASLMLLKPTLGVAHQGGLRFATTSPSYELLRRWIEEGAGSEIQGEAPLAQLDVTPSEQVLVDPQHDVQLAVVARFADGAARDVTSLAVYELTNQVATVAASGRVSRQSFGETTILVRYLDRHVPVRLTFTRARPEFVWRGAGELSYIDRHVFAKLRSLRVNPAELCDDATFVRRVTLDTTGLLPTADDARRFVADCAPDKRAKLVDDLLARPEFADRWAALWADLLRCEEKALDATGVQAYYQWIRRSMAQGKPLDQFAREILSAQGSTYSVPATNFYRALRDPISRAETVAQVFLGTRLQCAKCHNHPFDRWTQDDYYRWAALFARVDYEIVKNDRRDKFDKHEFKGEQIVKFIDKGEVRYPNSSRKALPKYLGADTPLSGATDRLTPLAAWIGRADHPLFARVQANRIWYHLVGRGVVEPVDDFRRTNPAENPGLLDALADDFVRQGFDVRQLVRRIVLSHTYQAASILTEGAPAEELDDAPAFARAVVRRLPAEPLLDACCQVLDVPAGFADQPEGTRAGQLPGNVSVRRRDRRADSPEQFLQTFGKPMRLLACECERSDEATLAQAFALVSGSLVTRLIEREDNRLGRLARSGMSPREMIEELYWTALSRPPSTDELAALLPALESAPQRRAALQDLAWALVNSKEFILRH